MKWTNDLQTDGGEYLLNGIDYVGAYNKNQTDDGMIFYFTGKAFNPLSLPLVAVPEEVKKYQSISSIRIGSPPKAFYPIPTSTDYNRGWFNRYFAKRANDDFAKITEISKETFDKFSSRDKSVDWALYHVVELRWKITGFIRDTFNKNNKLENPGVIDTNIREVERAGLVIDGLGVKLLDKLEFYKNTMPNEGILQQIRDFKRSMTQGRGISGPSVEPTAEPEVESPPSTPAITCIANINEASPQFCWATTLGADTYEFQLADDSGFTSLVVSVTGLTSTCYTFVGNLGPGTYYWRVRAKAIHGTFGEWSESCNITVTPFFNITAKTSTTVSVEWGNLHLATTAIRLQRSGALNSDTIEVATFRTSTTASLSTSSFTDTNLLPGFPYVYRLIEISSASVETSGSVSDVSTITNPLGAYTPINGGGGSSTALFNRNDVPDFFAGTFDHQEFTIDFWLKNDGTTSGDIWKRQTLEFGQNIYKEGIIRLVGNAFEITLTRYFTDTNKMTFVQVPTGVSAVVGETHHWAFVFDINNIISPYHSVYIYKDGVIQNPGVSGATITSLLPNPVTTYWDYIFTPASFYSNQSNFGFMSGVSGSIDEFRAWSIALTQNDIASIMNFVIRENPFLMYRFGFDNYSLQASPYDAEFGSYGQTAWDNNDIAGTSLTINRNISEPLGVSGSSGPALPITAQTPLLKSPANGDIFDTADGTFRWLSPQADYFEFEIASDAGFTAIVHQNLNVPDQFYTPVGLNLFAGTTYYWRVRGILGETTSSYSTTFNFTSNIVITSLITNPHSDTVTEPFDTSTSIIITNPTGSIATEPFDTQLSIVFTNPSSDTVTEPFDTQTNIMIDNPTSDTVNIP